MSRFKHNQAGDAPRSISQWDLGCQAPCRLAGHVLGASHLTVDQRTAGLQHLLIFRGKKRGQVLSDQVIVRLADHLIGVRGSDRPSMFLVDQNVPAGQVLGEYRIGYVVDQGAQEISFTGQSFLGPFTFLQLLFDSAKQPGILECDGRLPGNRGE